MAGSPLPPVATRREWLGLTILALPSMVYAMDLTVLNLAIPAISAELRPGGAQLLWMIDIYGFFVAGFLITMGTLGDRLGRRRVLMWGAAAFALASLLAALARSAEALIAARALLGIAGATLAPSTMSLIRNMFHDERERQFAFGVWIASLFAGWRHRSPRRWCNPGVHALEWRVPCRGARHGAAPVARAATAAGVP